MILISNYNKKNKNWLPMLSIINDIDTTKKEIKKQIIDQIINDPSSLKIYKNLEIYKVGECTETMELKNIEKILLFTYEDILKEIIDDLTKEKGEKYEQSK